MNTITYRIQHRELFRQATQRWREKRRVSDPDYTRVNQAQFRQANPNYHREWRSRIKLKRAWLKWTQVMAANRPLEAQ